ncbi:hypothetical protein ACQP2F_03225 [Actinoplanes sp. CA-030573]|uniref:hypothetical protein n=1 Tax=Actinoplanes sp. CA-030573 TaxID=3239898 RepID=UPI003D8DAF7C
MTPDAVIVVVMTQTMKHQMLGWRRRTGLAALGAAVAVAAALGPETLATTRLGAASEQAGYATVTAADTITSHAVLAEVAAATGGVSKTL